VRMKRLRPGLTDASDSAPLPRRGEQISAQR
jgi:hypothetical protein